VILVMKEEIQERTMTKKILSMPCYRPGRASRVEAFIVDGLDAGFNDVVEGVILESGL